MLTEATFDLRLGDCLEGLASVESDSVDAMVTDPPAGIGFMGKSWDSDKGGRVGWIEWLESVMREALRVLKPGAHGVVWALPRTSHWTATALEQGGFEIRDVITHHFGTGFPKSLNVSKAIDEAAGATREVVGTKVYADGTEGHWGASEKYAQDEHTKGLDGAAKMETAPATDAAKQWSGWGTALKPASEHWILVRKPLAGTIAANVQEHGTGALNIEATRIQGPPSQGGTTRGTYLGLMNDDGWKPKPGVIDRSISVGRWPANLVLSHSEWCEDGGACLPGCPVALLDTQSGTSKSSASVRHNTAAAHNVTASMGKSTADWNTKGHADTGTASRFFYTSKPTTAEREENVRDLPRRAAADLVDREAESAGMSSPRAGAGRTSRGRANIHPTVKSVALMSWLITLVTPPGGLVLDPFAGSGTTGVAAIRLGHRFLGFEMDPDYHRIALAKLERARRGEQLSLT